MSSCPASGGAEGESEPLPPLSEAGAATENGAPDSSDSKEEVEEKDKEEDAEVEQEEEVTPPPLHTHTRTNTAAPMMSHIEAGF